MKKKITVLTLCAMLLALCLPAEAQQPKKVPQIGFLGSLSFSTDPDRREAFRQGLRELGYVEGKNIVIEWRFAEGNADRLPSLAAELVRLKVAVIVTGGSAVTRAAKEATITIPIIMTADGDPVADGFVAALARPGRNITGLSTLAPEISGKQLEILKEIVPRLSRVAVLGTSTRPGNAQALREVELAAGVLRVQLQYVDVLGSKDFETAFQTVSKGRADAILVLDSSVLGYSTQIAARAEEPAPGDILQFVKRQKRRAYVLCDGLFRLGQTCRCLRRQNSKRHKAC